MRWFTFQPKENHLPLKIEPYTTQLFTPRDSEGPSKSSGHGWHFGCLSVCLSACLSLCVCVCVCVCVCECGLAFVFGWVESGSRKAGGCYSNVVPIRAPDTGPPCRPHSNPDDLMESLADWDCSGLIYITLGVLLLLLIPFTPVCFFRTWITTLSQWLRVLILTSRDTWWRLQRQGRRNLSGTKLFTLLAFIDKPFFKYISVGWTSSIY